MDQAPAPGTPAGPPLAVVITKPGHEPVRFGPLDRAIAAEWAGRLRIALTWARHPPGTVVGALPVYPHLPYVDPATIPDTAEALAILLPADLAGDDDGGGFPGLFARLYMAHGQTRAQALWAAASRLADMPGGEELAASGADRAARAAAARAAAAACVERAYTAIQVAIARTYDVTDAGYAADLLDEEHPGAAAQRMDDALLSLLEAGRMLSPAVRRRAGASTA